MIMLPAPIFKMSPGTAGFVFAADILAVALAGNWLLRIIITRRLKLNLNAIQRYAVVLLLLFPLVTSFVTLIESDTFRNIKYALLAHARGLGYLIIFIVFVSYVYRARRPDNILMLQISLFSIIAILGLIQYTAGINLDLWNEVGRNAAETTEVTDFGGGFMGLYRGAVGAWGAGILAVAGTVLPTRKNGAAILAVVVMSCMGIMLSVGSRQGVIIGGICLILGVWMVCYGMPIKTRGRLFIRSLIGLIIVIVLGMTGLWKTGGSRFERFIVSRYSPLRSYTTLLRELSSRDELKRKLVIENIYSHPGILFTGVGYGTDLEVTGGKALIYLDSEIFMLLQSNGALYLLLYLVFLLRIRLFLGRAYKSKDVTRKTYILGTTGALYAGILLMWGHFYLMNIGASQAPVAYWNWALLGGALGICSQCNCRSMNHNQHE